MPSEYCTLNILLCFLALSQKNRALSGELLFNLI